MTTTPPDSPDLSNRAIRHRDIIKPEKVASASVTLIGVGAIGSLVAKQLAHIGVENIRIVDFDTVDVENLAVQGFIESDLGKLKVEAVAEACLQINSAVTLKTSKNKFRPEMISNIKIEEPEPVEDGEDPPEPQRFVVISAVDKMEVRKEIWEAYAEKFKGNSNALFIDSRMASEIARVLAVSATDERDYYERTLFSEGEGLQQSCTAKSTIYCANIAAGLVVGTFTRWLRGMRPNRDTLLNILSGDVLHDSENLA